MKTSANSRKAARRAKSTVSKAKIAARMAKTTKVGTDTPAQLKAELMKTAYNPLITPAVLKAVSKTVTAIDKALANERVFSVNIGGLLSQLKSGIKSHLKESGGRVPKDSVVNPAFYDFVQVRFKIGMVRVREYIRLADRDDLHGFDLPSSVLIELSRLKKEPLAEFIEKHPVSEMKGLSFKEIKSLVKVANAASRTSSSKKSSTAPKPESIAKQLKATFEIVRGEFENKPAMDRELDTVLGDISVWYLTKKKAA